MPNRIIKDSVRKSDSIDSLNWFEEVFFYRLIVTCDDYGRYDARPKILKAELFPLKDGITLKQITDALNKLSTVGMVQLYEYEQKPYLQLTAWGLHQQIRNKRSKFPEPDIACNQLISNAPVIQSESESESESNARASAPCAEIKNLFNQICVSLPEVKALSDSRKSKIKTRWVELGNLELFEMLFRLTEESDFLTGKSGKWKASFDWLMENDKNYIKVLEGNYNNEASEQQKESAQQKQQTAELRRKAEEEAEAILEKEREEMRRRKPDVSPQAINYGFAKKV